MAKATTQHWTPQLEPARGVFRLVRFDSVSQIVKFALGDALCRCSDNNKILSRFWHKNEGSGYWNCFTVEEFLWELRNPSRRRLEAVHELREQIRLSLPPRPSVSRRVRVGMPDGEELDPMAWIRRDPDGWAGLVRVERPSSSRLVRIACNVSASCEKTQEHVLHRGAAIAALADVLTARGRSVEVVALMGAFNSWRGGGSYAQRIVVKRGGDPLDLPALALCLSEIAFMRIVCLSAMIKFAPAQVLCGLGVPVGVPDTLVGDYDAVADFDILSKESALAFVSGQAERQCVASTQGV